MPKLKRTEPWCVISSAIPVGDVQWLDRQAAANRKTRSALIAQLIRQARASSEDGSHA